jgi:cytochrome oxidase Cu insertion factor (SCO1/SenC/PrrC family)
MLAGAALQRTLAVVLVALLAAIGVVLLSSTGTRGSGGSATAAGQPVISSTGKFDGSTMPPGLRAADFSLTDQNGRRVTLSQYRGKVIVLTFIHSLCKDTCPFMVEQIKGALNLLPGNGGNVPAIGVSVEPAQDTAAHRRWFLAKHQMTGRMEFLNGPGSVMERVWHDYAIQPVSGLVDHSTFVLLISKRGYEVIGDPADQLTPESLAHDIGALEREPA